MISSTSNVRAITVAPQDEPDIRTALYAAIRRLDVELADAPDDAKAALGQEKATLHTLFIAFGG